MRAEGIPRQAAVQATWPWHVRDTVRAGTGQAYGGLHASPSRAWTALEVRGGRIQSRVCALAGAEEQEATQGVGLQVTPAATLGGGRGSRGGVWMKLIT